MLINWGRRSVRIRNIPPQHCLSCGDVRPFSIRLQYGYFGFFWIFLTSWAERYIYCCDVCEHGYELPEDIQENIENAVIPWFSRYGLWIFLAVVVAWVAVLFHQDSQLDESIPIEPNAGRRGWGPNLPIDRERADEIIDTARMTAAQKIFAYGQGNIVDDVGTELHPLSVEGIDTLRSLYKDTEDYTSTSAEWGSSASSYNDVDLSDDIRAFTTVIERNKLARTSSTVGFTLSQLSEREALMISRIYYVDDKGAQILMLFKAFRIMEPSTLKEFTALINWSAEAYNARDCFYIYDNRMIKTFKPRRMIRKRY